MLDDIGSVLAGPDIVTPDLALEVYRFYRWFDVTPKGPKYLVVMAKMTATDAWVLTAWLTDRVR
ncbi:MAG: hypothetical protein FJ319_00280 [SAR202 cluster bacterium]|nr:hypothetical protein [SAR202 cluster bacterium]